MKNTTKLFKGQKVRAAWDSTNKKYWVSVIDICAVLCGSNYDTARNYWKQFKHRLIMRGSHLVKKMHQLKMAAKDGKMRYTDAMDYKKIMQLIQSLPRERAMAFKAWIGAVAAGHSNIIAQLDIDYSCAGYGVSELRCIKTRVMFNNKKHIR